MNSFWIELDGLLCQRKTNFTKPGPLPTSKMKLFVTIVDSWKLLTSVSSSLDPPWLNYDFRRTEEGCSKINSLVAYVDMWMVGDPFSFLIQTQNVIMISMKLF